MNNETIIDIILKNLNEGLSKKEIRKINFLSEEYIPEDIFNVCFLLAKNKTYKKNAKMLRDEKKGEKKRIILNINWDTYEKLKEYGNLVLYNEKNYSKLIEFLISDGLDLKIKGKREELYGY